MEIVSAEISLSSMIRPLPEPVKSPQDKRLYRRIQLPNQLDVLLIEDPEMESAPENGSDVSSIAVSDVEEQVHPRAVYSHAGTMYNYMCFVSHDWGCREVLMRTLRTVLTVGRKRAIPMMRMGAKE